MPEFKSLANTHPMKFGLVVTIVFILLVLAISILVGRALAAETTGWYIGSTIGRLISIFILLIVLARLGWLHSAGFTSLGQRRTWFFLLFPLAYSIAVSAYAMTGNFDFSFSDPLFMSIVTLFLMAHAFLEETSFRGLVMHRLVRAWGGANRGVLKSVLVSSLFFGGMHIIYLAGEPLPIVLLRIAVATLLGIFFGALILRAGSIYPAAFFHGVWNVAGYLNLTNNGAEANSSSWLLLSLFMLPLALYGLHLLRDLSQPFTNSKGESHERIIV